MFKPKAGVVEYSESEDVLDHCSVATETVTMNESLNALDRRVQFSQAPDIVLECPWIHDGDDEQYTWYSRREVNEFKRDCFLHAQVFLLRDRAAHEVGEATWTTIVWQTYQSLCRATTLEEVNNIMEKATTDCTISLDALGLDELVFPGWEKSRNVQKRQIYSAVTKVQACSRLDPERRARCLRKACRERSRAGRLLAIYQGRLLAEHERQEA